MGALPRDGRLSWPRPAGRLSAGAERARVLEPYALRSASLVL